MVLVKLLSRTSDKSAKLDAPQASVSPDGHLTEPVAQPLATEASQPSSDARGSISVYSSDTRPEGAPHAIDTSAIASMDQSSADLEGAQPAADELKPPVTRPRRFSWRALSIFNGNTQEEHKHVLTADEEERKKVQVVEDKVKRTVKVTTADRKARESALVVRSLIVGQSTIAFASMKGKPVVSKVSRPKVIKVKAELLQPKKANRLIAQLRALPASNDVLPPATKADMAIESPRVPAHPIHAVCLPLTEEEADVQHFSKLTAVQTDLIEGQTTTGVRERSVNVTFTSVYSTSIAQLKTVLEDMNVVSLITPDMGLGEPADQPGLLSGAIPSPRTIIEGVEQITPQLMSLGYATGKALLPDHHGVHPPTDRMSVLTYWWGFEVVLPPPSIVYLSKAPSIAHSAVNVLTALAVLNNGVAEILPFVRYIASFIDTEFSMIMQQDEGKGVVCAATWLIPAALVPRPWDFTDEPIVKVEPASTEPVPEPSSVPAREPTEPTHANHEPSMSLPNPYSEDPIPVATVQQASATAAPPSNSPAPSLPPLPASPTLMAPMPTFESDEPAKAPQDALEETVPAASEDKDVPEVTVVPPTPPTSHLLKDASTVEETAVSAEAVGVAA